MAETLGKSREPRGGMFLYREKGGIERGSYDKRSWSVVAFHWLSHCGLLLVGSVARQGENHLPPSGVVKYASFCTEM